MTAEPLLQAADRPELSTWSIPSMSSEAPQEVTARAGEVTTVVGANGAGKSALGMWMHQNSRDAPSRRLIAHRRLWFQSAGPEISPGQRQSMAQHMSSWSQMPDSRYLDHADGQRADIVLFDVLAKLNTENARIADLAVAQSEPEVIEQLASQRVLSRLNGILAGAGLAVQLTLTEEQTFNAINTNRNAEYPIFQMSDGEKSAVLLASEVLTAERGSVQIIDEPERHLHRSISASLIEAIVSARPDCHFVVLTHDLDLASALDQENHQTFVLMDCRWSGLLVNAWDLFPIDTPAQIPEVARRAILGGRRDVLFIEGQADSLDRKLYSLLFPGWALAPSGGGLEVMRAVAGLRASQAHHWVRARGVVDGDGRTPAEREELRARGVLALPVSEVESLYYLDVVVRAVAAAQAEALERSAVDLEGDARRRALVALRSAGTFERLAGKLALEEVRRRIVEQLPTDIDAQADPIEVSIASPFASILSRMEALSAGDDLDGLVRLLPVRDTALRDQVASALGFRSIADYEAAVRVRIRTDASLASLVRAVAGPLPAEA